MYMDLCKFDFLHSVLSMEVWFLLKQYNFEIPIFECSFKLYYMLCQSSWLLQHLVDADLIEAYMIDHEM